MERATTPEHARESVVRLEDAPFGRSAARYTDLSNGTWLCYAGLSNSR
ncbi:hypothetical protein Pla86_32990 [Planctomycetes bacterium Pla86]|uniref:Uncharacterized protein n=1 Tax=Engelhardtia mirabilis TaxID=2528011 RepID=A0A518BMP4_9BACT|nr:hypothetical protein Pla133_33000 [Planctomycetes bacterium Pla133]QDV02532.1 hypothetical protein Pla86_32990 [Planctomycetes bacterium Pla86]